VSKDEKGWIKMRMGLIPLAWSRKIVQNKEQHRKSKREGNGKWRDK
jgi:hypothetical protein